MRPWCKGWRWRRAASCSALALPRSFFEDYGWAAGPGVWALCALLTAAVLRLPALPVLAGAALAGIPSLVTVLLGAHWAGVPLAVGIFARLVRVAGRDTRPVGVA